MECHLCHIRFYITIIITEVMHNWVGQRQDLVARGVARARARGTGWGQGLVARGARAKARSGAQG